MVNTGGKLKAEALAKRGCCLHKDILAIEGCGDNLPLLRSWPDITRQYERIGIFPWSARFISGHSPEFALIELAA